MIRRQLKHFEEFKDALAFALADEVDRDLQIRRRKKGFDVVERKEGTTKQPEKVKGAYTKAKKKRRSRRGSVQFGTNDQA